MNSKRLGGVLLLMVVANVAVTLAEEWSWGTDKKDTSTLPPTDVSTSQSQHAGGDSSSETKQEDREARFLGIGQKLCAVGIGSKCDKKPYPPALDSHYGPPAASAPSSSSSYATLNYDDKLSGHGYPSASSSKDFTGSLKPFFVAPKPFPNHAASKPSHTFPNAHNIPPVVNPTYVAPIPAHTNSLGHVKTTEVVQHIHTHTHIHQGVSGAAPSGSVGVIPSSPVGIIPPVSTGFINPSFIGGQASGSGVIPSIPVGIIPPVSTGFTNPSFIGGQASGSGFKPVTKPIIGGSFTPVHLSGPIIEVDSPAYREECQCLARSLCPLEEIVPRRSPVDISAFIDARSRGSDILSNATDSESEVSTTIAPENGTSSAPSVDGSEKVLDLADSHDESRQKRDLLTSAVHDHDEHLTDIQERQFSGYAPGLTGCNAGHVCCRNPVYAAPKQQYTCGKSNAAGVLGRVKNPYFVNGDAEFAEYPWQAAILKLEQGESVYVCGAALISDRHLLTAAHCVNSVQPATLKVRLGEWDVSTTAEFYQHIEIHVANVNIHPEYYAGNLQNDIAIITLQNVVDFTKNPHVVPVCLPESYGHFVGQRCHSTGWGKDAFGEGGKFQSVLKEVEVPVVSHLQCQTALKHTHLGASFSLHEGNICAGGEEGRDTCKGDGGGPLVCAGPHGNAQLVGLVSWGIGCGKVGIPGVYVNVAHYLDWIRASV